MATIFIYKRIPVKTIKKEAKEGIKMAEAFFHNNPRRKVAYAQGWYDKMIKIRRGHVQEDIDAATKQALK